MNAAWTAWKAATRFMFWQMVESVTCAIAFRKDAQRELTAFNPRKPKDLYDSGYAVFFYDFIYDSWLGTWRAKDESAYCEKHPQFIVHEWTGVPWHPVKFKDFLSDGREFRAVSLDYAMKNLRDKMRVVA